MNRDARVWSPDGLDSFADAMWRASIDLMQKRARDILTLVCRADLYDGVGVSGREFRTLYMADHDARALSPDDLKSSADVLWRASIDVMQRRARYILALVWGPRDTTCFGPASINSGVSFS